MSFKLFFRVIGYLGFLYYSVGICTSRMSWLIFFLLLCASHLCSFSRGIIMFSWRLTHSRVGMSISSVWCLGTQPPSRSSVCLPQSAILSSLVKEPGTRLYCCCGLVLGLKER